MKVNWVRALAALIGITACSCTGGAASSAQSKPIRWILNGPAMTEWTTNPTSVAFFGKSAPFVVISKQRHVTIPSSWNAVPTRIFTSYREFARALQNGRIDPQIKAVLYDNEAWNLTPEEEQDDFPGNARRFAELAHAHGYFVIITPATSLARKHQAAGERRFDTFLRLNIPADAARYADAYDIQAQGSQVPSSVFRRYVSEAAQQARAANPKILVFAGISTNPSGHHMTSEQIVAAIKATRDVVDGYWFNVPQAGPSCPHCSDFRPDMAIDVISALKH